MINKFSGLDDKEGHKLKTNMEKIHMYQMVSKLSNNYI